MTAIPSPCIAVGRVQDLGEEFPLRFEVKVDKWKRPTLGDMKMSDKPVEGQGKDTNLLMQRAGTVRFLG